MMLKDLNSLCLAGIFAVHFARSLSLISTRTCSGGKCPFLSDSSARTKGEIPSILDSLPTSLCIADAPFLGVSCH